MRRMLLLFLFSFLSVYAQDISKVHFVRASGEATIDAKPDRAQLSIGVMTQAATAQAAAAQNATGTTQVIDSLKRALGPEGQIKTSGYAISPQYAYDDGHPPRLTGYQASNTVLVTDDNLANLGKVIDAATSAGANNVNGISFSLRDETEVKQKALVEAAQRAKANAETIARALNLRVTGILQAEPTEMPVIRPMPMAMAVEGIQPRAQPTPIESGNLNITAHVTVVLQVEQ
ncbi:MAG: SIMPL domain-containing protein [Acidobacteriaceae bacterium]|nr:SIMPL domain-containing protein [Acidobacteriaceae bacterium]MBV8571946.1 SIMPL domain-containing protein [Acidobacteriaceae bacterium]